MKTILEIYNQQELEKLKEQFEMLVIIFYTDWLSEAKKIIEDFQIMSNQYENEIQFVTVNIDFSQELQIKYNVISLPTTLIIKEKEVKERILVWSKKSILKIIDENMAKSKV